MHVVSAALSVELFTTDSTPVCCTHLDVYKGQALEGGFGISRRALRRRGAATGDDSPTMSLLERVRTTVTARRETVHALREQPQPLRVWVSGAVAVAVPWLVTVALVVLIWAVTPGSDTPWGQVIGTGSAGWFLSTGGRVAVDGVVVGVVPLLGWALAAWFTAYQLRHISAHTGEVLSLIHI